MFKDNGEDAMTVEIQGQCDARFDAVRKTFEEAFARGDELGASVCVTLENRVVVDLWAGYMDKERTRPTAWWARRS